MVLLVDCMIHEQHGEDETWTLAYRLRRQCLAAEDHASASSFPLRCRSRYPITSTPVNDPEPIPHTKLDHQRKRTNSNVVGQSNLNSIPPVRLDHRPGEHPIDREPLDLHPIRRYRLPRDGPVVAPHHPRVRRVRVVVCIERGLGAPGDAFGSEVAGEEARELGRAEEAELRAAVCNGLGEGGREGIAHGGEGGCGHFLMSVG